MQKLTVVGLGYGDPEAITSAAWHALKGPGRLLLRTTRHPAVKIFDQFGLKYDSMDHCYQEEENFQGVYKRICNTVISALADSDVVYAVPGDPGMGEQTVTLLREAARGGKFGITVLPGVSFVEPVLAALETDLGSGLQIMDALSVEMPNPRLPLLFFQVFNRLVASELKLSLLPYYPGEHPVTIVKAAGLADAQVARLTLGEMDHMNWFDHLTSVYLPPVDKPTPGGHITSLLDIMAMLRGPGGCPWDKEQTAQSLIPYVLEEAYELAEAATGKNEYKICEELGDLLLQIAFYTQLAREQNQFDFTDVVETITAKLVRRHPHVFLQNSARDSADVEKIWQWEKLKENNPPSHPAFPGLLALHKLYNRGQLNPEILSDPLLRKLALLVAQAAGQGRCLETEATKLAQNQGIQ